MQTRWLSIAALLAATALPENGLAQAMIGYAHGVAKAGVTGAAVGAGAAGVFGKLKGVLGGAEKGSSRPATAGATELREKIEASPVAKTSGPVKLAGGITVSGLSGSSPAARRPAYRPGAVTVHRVAWSGETGEPEPQNPDWAASASSHRASSSPVSARQQRSPADEQADSSAARRVEAGAEGSAAPSVEHSVKEAAIPPVSVIIGSPNFSAPGGSAAASPNSLAPAPAPERSDSEIAGLPIGSSIEEAIALFGKPRLVFRGLGGDGFTEKYVFQDADGRKVIVLAWYGTVTSVRLV